MRLKLLNGCLASFLRGALPYHSDGIDDAAHREIDPGWIAALDATVIDPINAGVTSERLLRVASALGDRSPRDVAATDAGMLMIRDLLAEMEWHARYRKLDALYQSREDGATRELTLLLDLLPLAWGMNDPEFEELLKVPNNWLRLWQDHKVEVGPQRERLLRLRRLFDAFRAILRPRDLAAAWHSAWNAESPIGERSLLQAFQEDGDVALDRIELYLWGLAERDLSR